MNESLRAGIYKELLYFWKNPFRLTRREIELKLSEGIGKIQISNPDYYNFLLRKYNCDILERKHSVTTKNIRLCFERIGIEKTKVEVVAFGCFFSGHYLEQQGEQ